MLALRYVPESRADLGHRRFDAAGATTVTAGLLAIVFGIVKAQAWGWGSDKTLGVLGFGARPAGRSSSSSSPARRRRS